MATEQDMIDALCRRYAFQAGNGSRYACASHVRSAAGFDARRTCDFMALDLWPSKGLHLIGHEIKCSRSDWLRELKDPTKAEEFTRYCDRWYVVVPDPDIVRPNELPDGWGMLSYRKRGHGRYQETYLHEVHRAPVLSPEPMPRTLTCALVRAVEKTATRRTFTDTLFERNG